MATRSSILAWRIPWTEEPGELQCMELQSQTRLSDSHTHTHTHTHTQVDFPRLVERINPVFPGYMQPRLPTGLTVFSQGLPRY